MHILTDEEMDGHLKKFVTDMEKLIEPIDCEGLERKGIIKQRGAWYEIFDKNALPENFMELAKAMRFVEKKKTGKRSMFVKLEKQSEYESLLEKFKRKHRIS